MDSRFKSIYGLVRDFYKYGQEIGELANRESLSPKLSFDLVETVVDAAIKNHGVEERLRVDARLFLVTNLHLMVAMPVFADMQMGPSVPAESESGEGRKPIKARLSRPKFEEALRHDVSLILESCSHRRSKEISGGVMLRTVAKVYSKLRLSKLEIWG